MVTRSYITLKRQNPVTTRSSVKLSLRLIYYNILVNNYTHDIFLASIRDVYTGGIYKEN